MAARLAELADLPALVPVLARAFADDPFISWLVRTDARRAAGFARFFELTVIGEHAIAGGPTMWFMWRAPGRSAPDA